MIELEEYSQEEYERDMRTLLAEKGLSGAIKVYADKINEEVTGTSYVLHRTVQEYLCDILFLAQAAQQWIPCSERLPENGTHCLVTRYDYVTDTPFVDMLWFDNSWWNRINSGDYNVTHWMPLPDAPYVDEDGGN